MRTNAVLHSGLITVIPPSQRKRDGILVKPEEGDTAQGEAADLVTSRHWPGGARTVHWGAADAKRPAIRSYR